MSWFGSSWITFDRRNTIYKRKTFTLCALALFTAASACADSIWNDVADFNHTGVQPQTGNPWTYGFEPSVNGAFSLFNLFNTTCPDGNCPPPANISEGYRTDPVFNAGPQLAWNSEYSDIILPDGGGLHQVADGLNTLSLGAGGNDPVVLRWTAPADMTVDLSGYFEDQVEASTGLHVIVNTTSGPVEFNGSFSGESPLQGRVPFSFTDVSVAAGSKIDFIVDNGGNGSADDVVGVAATISETPEPASVLMFGSGLVLLLIRSACTSRRRGFPVPKMPGHAISRSAALGSVLVFLWC